MINDYSIEISFLTKEQISKLNKEFLNHLGPTDVITFNYSNITNQNTLTGEILVCPDIALEQSKLYSTTFENELLRYIIHGILHLLGFNDESPVEKRKMRIKENKILAASKSVWIDNNFVKNQR
jgi:probable rRNA maturation factor